MRAYLKTQYILLIFSVYVAHRNLKIQYVCKLKRQIENFGFFLKRDLLEDKTHVGCDHCKIQLKFRCNHFSESIEFLKWHFAFYIYK